MTYSKIPITSKSIGDLEFLTGAWRGQSNGDIFEEHWTQEIEGNMTGMFRWIKSSEVFVYEIMALVKREDNIHLFLRHFSEEFAAWEEKEKSLVFVVTELTDSKVVFTNPEKPDVGCLSYEIIDEQTLLFRDLEADGTIGFELRFQKLS